MTLRERKIIFMSDNLNTLLGGFIVFFISILWLRYITKKEKREGENYRGNLVQDYLVSIALLIFSLFVIIVSIYESLINN